MTSLFLSASGPGGFLVLCAKQSSLPLLHEWLSAQRFGYASVDAKEIRDKSSLLRSLVSAVDPEALKEGDYSNWDAAADDLWWGLTNQKRSHFALLVFNTDVLLTDHFPLLLQVLEVLFSVGNSTERYKPHSTEKYPHPVRLRVVLLGEGPQFLDLRSTDV